MLRENRTCDQEWGLATAAPTLRRLSSSLTTSTARLVIGETPRHAHLMEPARSNAIGDGSSYFAGLRHRFDSGRMPARARWDVARKTVTNRAKANAPRTKHGLSSFGPV